MTLVLPDTVLRRGVSWFQDSKRRRRLFSTLGLGLAIAAPICAIVTYLLASGYGPQGGNGLALRIMFVVDFCLAIALIGVIAWRIAALVIAKRSRSAGSRLHLRMVRMFTMIAVAPALLLGLFAAITVTFTLESWLNDKVGGVVRNSVQIAESYVNERHQTIRLDASVVAGEIARVSPYGTPTRTDLANALAAASQARRLVEIYVINSSGEIVARGPNSYLFLYKAPDSRHLENVRSGEVYVYEDQQNDAIRALMPLSGVFDAYLYLVRPVDGEAARVLSETRALASQYARLEAQRGDIQLLFATLYIGFAILILSAAIWLGIWLADRLARPIGRLAGAADRVAKGDLNARVHEEPGDDEIATLSRAFNRMTSQVQRQRDTLLTVNDELDQRRRFTEAVISGVTAGVVGFDADRRVDLMNDAAARILESDAAVQNLEDIERAVPGVYDLVETSRVSPAALTEGRVIIASEAGDREYLVRVACQRSADGVEGYVMTLDDMTALVSAQRLAAWGDVARRVAHEIRNPLTPIQLSAERLKRKFSKQVDENRPAFEQCVDTIVRQVEQIRRMVEEFSNFARMPKPEFAEHRLLPVLSDSVQLQAAAYPQIRFVYEPEDVPLLVRCDDGLLSQAFTNLLRNAAQSVAIRYENEAQQGGGNGDAGLIETSIDMSEEGLTITILDNGVGLPLKERDRLTEPYVTTRKGGTGLGLAIVRRIIEDHGGTLTLSDRSEENPGTTGARVRIELPESALVRDLHETQDDLVAELKRAEPVTLLQTV